MEPTKLNRRSFVTTVSRGIVAGGAFAVITGVARAQTYTGVTDSDTGSNSDNAGYGRGGNRAVSDNDPTDPAGHGRHTQATPVQPQSGVTDSDRTDQTGYGRGGSSGYSDNDSGANADPSGHGRHGQNAWTGYTNSDGYDRAGYGRNVAHTISDGDSGPYADPPGQGRGNTRYRCTDSDSGPNADPGGQGRKCTPR